jgi:N-acetylglucosamine kinase-like BadF-type ATPase
MNYVVGVDGGATKTAGILLDLKGHILAHQTVGPTNYQIVGPTRVTREIFRLVQQLFADAGMAPEELAGLALGLAGAGRPGEPQEVAALVAEYELAGKVVVEHDGMIALVGALAGEPGLIMIAGTGSIVLGSNAAGDRARVGGWGYLLGDEGSGFYIARRALMAVLRAHDGRGRETMLSKVILDGLKLNSPDLIVPRIYRQGMSHTEIADLAPLVFAAAGQGDAVAREILQGAGRELGLRGACSRIGTCCWITSGTAWGRAYGRSSSRRVWRPWEAPPSWL